jgi:hypothetical protein
MWLVPSNDEGERRGCGWKQQAAPPGVGYTRRRGEIASLRGRRKRGRKGETLSHSPFFLFPTPSSHPPTRTMATMEAAAVADPITDVAHPMDEQAGPFPIDKLQVRGRSKRELRVGREKSGRHAGATYTAARPLPLLFSPDMVEEGQRPTSVGGQHPVLGAGAWPQTDPRRVWTPCLSRPHFVRRRRLALRPPTARPKTVPVLPLPTRSGGQMDPLSLRGVNRVRQGWAEPPLTWKNTSVVFFLTGAAERRCVVHAAAHLLLRQHPLTNTTLFSPLLLSPFLFSPLLLFPRNWASPRVTSRS